VGSALGLTDEKLLALNAYATSPLFDEVERTALEYADSMTITGRDVTDELFAPSSRSATPVRAVFASPVLSLPQTRA